MDKKTHDIRLQEKLCNLFDVDANDCIDLNISVRPDTVIINATYERLIKDIPVIETVEKYWELVEIKELLPKIPQPPPARSQKGKPEEIEYSTK